MNTPISRSCQSGMAVISALLIVTVVAVDGESIILDINHPLAGKTLHFAVEVLAVRDATAEELNHGHVHGPGGHHH